MYNQLNWTNPNGATAITTNIYRDVVPINRASLGTPIVSLTAQETSYKDTGVTRGTTYYYVFETISASDRTVSQNYQIVATPRRGPGSNTLQVGDYNYGYFGWLYSANFINITALRAAINFQTGTTLVVSPKWHKYARNGKVIYVPEQLIANNVSWTSLYNAGLVFGSNDNGPYNAGSNVNQNMQVTIGADVFRVRLMRGYNDDYSTFPPTTNIAEPTNAFTCEYDDFIYPLNILVPAVQRISNRANLTPAQMGFSASASNYGILMQEKCTNAASTVPFVRGSGVTATRDGITRTMINANSLINANPGWWPVLELIEPAAV